jgi:hypothetical protein
MKYLCINLKQHSKWCITLQTIFHYEEKIDTIFLTLYKNINGIKLDNDISIDKKLWWSLKLYNKLIKK